MRSRNKKKTRLPLNREATTLPTPPISASPAPPGETLGSGSPSSISSLAAQGEALTPPPDKEYFSFLWFSVGVIFGTGQNSSALYKLFQ